MCALILTGCSSISIREALACLDNTQNRKQLQPEQFQSARHLRASTSNDSVFYVKSADISIREALACLDMTACSSTVVSDVFQSARHLRASTNRIKEIRNQLGISIREALACLDCLPPFFVSRKIFISIREALACLDQNTYYKESSGRIFQSARHLRASTFAHFPFFSQLFISIREALACLDHASQDTVLAYNLFQSARHLRASTISSWSCMFARLFQSARHLRASTSFSGSGRTLPQISIREALACLDSNQGISSRPSLIFQSARHLRASTII